MIVLFYPYKYKEQTIKQNIKKKKTLFYNIIITISYILFLFLTLYGIIQSYNNIKEMVEDKYCNTGIVNINLNPW